MSKYRNDLIKGAMAARDITRDQLAERTGLSVDTLSSIRNGSDSVSLKNLRRVADALDLDMAELFTTAPDGERLSEVAA